MPELRYLKLADPDSGAIDIADRIGTSYPKFGSILLNDVHGTVVQNIFQDKLKEIIPTNMEILRKWLTGSGIRPVTWQTLIKVMEASENTELARQIIEALTSRSKT